ncbi:FtsX-like permease family protein [Streptomyces sp. NPDC047821]|uniref:FtsX-like permease family protein n=1 Tax=Streptomyces sp. NPDC047821 TaxID=3365488 RepID=UPI003717940B
MQGFLALGLLIGVTGLGVVMVRAVRERRRTIGILRALGFRARTVQRSFLWESAFIVCGGHRAGLPARGAHHMARVSQQRRVRGPRGRLPHRGGQHRRARRP